MTQPNTIFFVIGSLDVGGAERHLLQVLPALDSQVWRPEVICLSGHGALAREFERCGISVHMAPLGGSASMRLWYRALRIAAISAWFLVRLLWRRPPLVHFFLPEAYLVGGMCAAATGHRRLVMSRRSLNCYQKKRPMIRRLERWLHPTMSAVLGNSCAVVRELAEEGVPPERLRLIYSGIDLRRMRPRKSRQETRAAIGIDPNALVLVKVANLIPYKGHADLLAALASACAQFPTPWRLICVGRDDGIGASLRVEASNRGLAENVLWLGERNDVADLLAASDIGVHCSHEEGFSNAVLEGMATGLAMVVTDVGGNAEAIVSGQSGLVVPSRDPEALAAALGLLASDSKQRRTLGDAAQGRVEREFSLASCVEKYERLYSAIRDGAPLPE